MLLRARLWFTTALVAWTQTEATPRSLAEKGPRHVTKGDLDYLRDRANLEWLRYGYFNHVGWVIGNVDSGVIAQTPFERGYTSFDGGDSALLGWLLQNNLLKERNLSRGLRGGTTSPLALEIVRFYRMGVEERALLGGFGESQPPPWKPGPPVREPGPDLPPETKKPGDAKKGSSG